MYIYKITNNINGKIYIGQTSKDLGKRFNEHMRSNSNCRKLKYAVKKYGKENFSIEELGGANSQSELNCLEKHYIALLNTRENGYNICSGGKFSKHTLESIELIRQANLGKKHTEETKQKLREGNAWKGKFGKNHNRSKPIRCVETGKEYGSIHEASRDIGRTASLICAVLNGRRKTTAGLTFEYIKERING